MLENPWSKHAHVRLFRCRFAPGGAYSTLKLMTLSKELKDCSKQYALRIIHLSANSGLLNQS